jgi:acetolactate synthase-1/2/3 large subunit
MSAVTAADLIAEFLVRAGVPYAVGIPGHGNLTLVDALVERQDRIKVLMVRHEQSAVHLADGYCRISGQPLVVFTSVGPGAVNTLVGVATAMADSIPVVVMTGNCQTYYFDRGAIQDVNHHHTADFGSMIRPVVKRSWQLNYARDLPDVLQRAFRLATTGRPGPVHIELPMDVQSDLIDAEVPDLRKYRAATRIPGDPAAIEQAADLILQAKRPVLLVGGGIILSDATDARNPSHHFDPG